MLLDTVKDVMKKMGYTETQLEFRLEDNYIKVRRINSPIVYLTPFMITTLGQCKDLHALVKTSDGFLEYWF